MFNIRVKEEINVEKAMLSGVFKAFRGLITDKPGNDYVCADGDPAPKGAVDLGSVGGAAGQKRRARLCDDPSYNHALKR